MASFQHDAPTTPLRQRMQEDMLMRGLGAHTRGEANAKANNRDVVQPWDLPITKASRRQSTDSGRLTRSCS